MRHRAAHVAVRVWWAPWRRRCRECGYRFYPRPDVGPHVTEPVVRPPELNAPPPWPPFQGRATGRATPLAPNVRAPLLTRGQAARGGNALWP